MERLQHRDLDVFNERHSHRHADAFHYAGGSLSDESVKSVRRVKAAGDRARHSDWSGDETIAESSDALTHAREIRTAALKFTT